MDEGRLVGKQLGEYRLEELVGSGAFLDVYKGKHTSIDRNVAVKVLNDATEQKRLKKETDILAKVGNNPGIVTLFDADPNHQNPYLAVEYCPNGSLADRLKQGKIAWEQATEIGIDILESLEYAHGKGVLHGDIKPSNIMFGSDENIRLSDFNAAEMNGDAVNNDASLAQSISLMRQGEGSRGFQGTVLYWTPEEKRGADIDARTDIHHVGQVMYEMITGNRFIDRDDGGVEEGGAPEWLNDVIVKATRASPDQRYKTAFDMREQLQLGLDGKLNAEPVPFLSEDVKVLAKKAGKGILKGLKYTGLTATSPVWGPIWLVKKFDEEYTSPVPLIASVLGAVAYYATGLIATPCIYENKMEKETIARVQPIIRNAERNQQLGYIEGETFNMTPVHTLLNENRKTTAFVLPNYGGIGFGVNGFVGEHEAHIFYTGKEEIKFGEDSIRVPQIFSLNLGQGNLDRLIPYSSEIAEKLEDEVFREVHIDTREGRPYSIAKIRDKWYQADGERLEELNQVSLPLNVPNKTRLQDGGIEFYSGGTVQFKRDGQFWGDVELFQGRHPVIFDFPSK